MGRSYLADVTVQEYVDTLICRNESLVGLVVGQMQFMPSKDLIVRLVPTPVAPSEDATSKKCLLVDAIDDQYIANHARQVLRMLSGGFDVIGVFACVHPDESKNAQTKLRQVLFTVHKILSKVDCLIGNYAHTERILLQICRLSKKLSCKTFDVADHKNAGSPCELKFQKSVDSFLQLQSSFSFDLVLPVATEMMNNSLQKQLMAGLQPLFVEISASIALVNGRLLPDGDALSQKTTSHLKGKRQHKNEVGDGDTPSEPFLIDLLYECPDYETPKSTLFSCGAKMLVRGTVASKAYATAKATVADAVQMLKKDIVRSIVSRCELLCEDLLQAEEEQDVKILYETPLRVFAALPGHEPIELCDYLFPDETVSDSAQRFSELLGLKLEDEAIDAEIEHMPNESDLEKPLIPERIGQSSVPSQLQSRDAGHIYQYIGVASTVLVASLAALVSQWFGFFSDQP